MAQTSSRVTAELGPEHAELIRNNRRAAWPAGGTLSLVLVILTACGFMGGDTPTRVPTTTAAALTSHYPTEDVISEDADQQAAPTATPTVVRASPDLQIRGEAPMGEALSPSPTQPPTQTPPIEPSITPSMTTSQTAFSSVTDTPAAPATATPHVEPTPVPADTGPAVSIRQETVIISTYPFAPFLREALDEQYNVPFWRLDREAYIRADKTLVDKSLTVIILENEYLRLTFLPELGGRLYQAVFKPTGQQLFYQNAVLKPSPWGPLSPEENWWLAAGGMEWAFPVDEHGYEWGVPWSYRVNRLNDGTARVTVWDTDARDRPWVEVTVALRPGQASFSVHPRILNPLSRPIGYQFWLNAMLTLGGTTAPADVQFVYPTTEMIVHSRGDDNRLPASGQTMSWPIYQGRNMAQYSNWSTYLGTFASDLEQDFVAAYSPTTSLGVVRSFPRSRASGVKLFGFGPHFSEWQRYTDDASRYVEIWGGVPRTFWERDNAVLAPGDVMEWIEHWYPFTAIGPPAYANRQAAISWWHEGGTLVVGLATTAPRSGTLSLTVGGEEILHQTVQVRPETPVQRSVSLPAGVPESVPLTVRFIDQNGQLIAEYHGAVD